MKTNNRIINQGGKFDNLQFNFASLHEMNDFSMSHTRIHIDIVKKY